MWACSSQGPSLLLEDEIWVKLSSSLLLWVGFTEWTPISLQCSLNSSKPSVVRVPAIHLGPGPVKSLDTVRLLTEKELLLEVTFLSVSGTVLPLTRHPALLIGGINRLVSSGTRFLCVYSRQGIKRTHHIHFRFCGVLCSNTAQPEGSNCTTPLPRASAVRLGLEKSSRAQDGDCTGI